MKDLPLDFGQNPMRVVRGRKDSSPDFSENPALPVLANSPEGYFR